MFIKMNKTIFIFVLMSMALANPAYSAESVAETGDNRAQVLLDPPPYSLDNKYFFSSDGSIPPVLKDVFPKNMYVDLEHRVDSNNVCTRDKHGHKSCEELHPTYLTAEELKYFHIKLGYSVVGIQDFKEIYRGPIVAIKCEKYLDYIADDFVHSYTMEFASTPNLDNSKPLVYVISEKSEDLKDIRGFLPGEYEVIDDKKVLDKYREMLIEEFSADMKDYEWLMPADIMQSFGKEYEKVTLLGKLPPEIRKKLLKQWLVLDARKITLPKVNGAFIKFGIRDLDERYYLLLGHDLRDLLGGGRFSFSGTMFVFNSNLAYMYTACSDICSDYLRIINGSDSLVQNVLIGED